MIDIVERLRRWSIDVNAVPASDLMDEAANEISRLRGYRDEAESAASIALLAAGRLRLTDAEREAIGMAERWARLAGPSDIAPTLRGLLERMK